MRGRIVASLATALALAGAPATTQGPQAQNFAPEQLKTGGSLRAQLLAVPRRAHARPAGRRRLEEIPARRARALYRFGDARQKPDAVLGRTAEARRGRGPVGLRNRGRENLIQSTRAPEALTTFAILAKSARSSALNAPGLSACGSTPCFARRSRID